MTQYFRPLYRTIVKYIPYRIKHKINVTRIRTIQKLRHYWITTYERLIPPTHPIREQYLRRLSWWYQLRIQRKEPILIYQMGKVGSTSIHNSLVKLKYCAFHIHSLDIDWMLPYFPPIVQTNLSKRHGPNWHWIRRNVIESGEKAKIIILTRDPVAINIAMFFELLDQSFQLIHAHEHHSIDEILKKYQKQQLLTYEYMFQWFGQELKNHFGVDVFQHPFNKVNGFCHIPQAPYDILILKLELNDSEKAKIIADFLGISEFEIVSSNVGDEKAYAEVYQQFKKQIRLDHGILDKAYHSPLATHFYTPEEIAKFRAKWEHKPVETT